MRIIATWLALAFLALNTPAAPKPHTTAELLLPVDAARPGDTVIAAVRLRMEPKWHTYWKNGGDSGAPTEINWELPTGVTAGEIQWPTPERLEAEGLTTFVYHNEVTLLVPLQFPANLKPGLVELKAKVSWLECEDLCVPGSGSVSGTLSIGDKSEPSAYARLIEAAKTKLPRTGWNFASAGRWENDATNTTRNLLIEWGTKGVNNDYEFFPYASNDYEVAPKSERLPRTELEVALRLQVKKSAANWPTNIGGLIVEKGGSNTTSYEVFVAPKGASPGSNPTGPTSKPAGSETGAPPKVEAGLVLNLLFALCGGLILNLMPCVLPILSLKVLSIVNQHGAPPGHARKHAVVYTLGVLVSFWVLGGLVIAGRLASWGEQFQDPRFVVIMTVLMTLVGLNLFGVFEVILPGATVNKATELSAKAGLSGAFFNGMLAVVLGASCVAPVLAGAIGWAFSKSPLVILLCFSMIGLGLALPFLLIGFFPILQKFLPKPGAWMEKFKMAMGFPMLATAIWLLTLTIDHFGDRGPLWVGLFLVLLGFAAWIYGEFHQRGSKRRGLAAVIALAIVGGAYGWTLESKLQWRHPPPIVASAGKSSSLDEPWIPWSTETVAKARAAGRPILIDFTAKWCLNCKLFSDPALKTDAVQAKLKAINGVSILGDYTLKQPEITEELKRFESAGVPLVLVYPKDASKPPKVLPVKLSEALVLEELDAAAK